MDGLAQLYDQGLADIHRDHLILTNPAEQPETPESASAPTEETLQSMVRRAGLGCVGKSRRRNSQS